MFHVKHYFMFDTRYIKNLYKKTICCYGELCIKVI